MAFGRIVNYWVSRSRPIRSVDHFVDFFNSISFMKYFTLAL